MHHQNRRYIAQITAVLIAAILVLLSACSLPQVSAADRIFLPLSLDFLAEYQLPQTTWEGTTVGGLSALAYDRTRDRLYALSDDHSRLAPARFYTLKLDVDATASGAGYLKQVMVEAVTLLKDDQGRVYPQDTIDPEGIALSPHRSVFISSEGVVSQNIPPFLAEFNLTGVQQRSFSIPQRYWHSSESEIPQGIANNLGFESLAINPEGDRLFTATESPLIQDFDTPSQLTNRLLHYWVGEPQPFLVSEHAYPLDPPPAGAIHNGLAELVAIDGGGHFLSLERYYSPLLGYGARIFQVANGGATDTSKIASFKGLLGGVKPARKRLLVDLAQLGIRLANLEGMVLGPRLADGTQSLLLVSDNDFKADQPTQFLLFRLQQS